MTRELNPFLRIRVCYACGSNEPGGAGWYLNEPIGALCSKCFANIIRHPKIHKPLVPKQCKYCERTDTYTAPNGKEYWFRDFDSDGNIIAYTCRYCYKRYHEQPRRNKEKDRLYGRRMITFKDRIVHLPEDPKAGVCNWCRAVVKQINAQTDKLCKHTNMHHFEYHDNDPLKDALELCASCHRRYHEELKKEYKKSINCMLELFT